MSSRRTPPIDEQPAATAQLRAENRLLRTHLQELLTQAHNNADILSRHHRINLKLIGAASLADLLTCIFTNLRDSAALDVVTLLAAEAEFDIRRVMSDLKIDPASYPNLLLLPNMNSADIAATYGSLPELGRFVPTRHRLLFPEATPTPASVGIVPLRRQERLIGYLNFGSRDPDRFNPGEATDFIEEQASIVAICLENVINNERLKHIGLTDPLTGVNNRRFIETRLHEEIRRAQRQGYALSCLYIDIDHFKQINDAFGHSDGDRVLCEVAERIKHELRLSDALGRFGGEEFVVLLIDTPAAGASLVAERIRANIAERPVMLASRRACRVTVSIGATSLQTRHANLPPQSVAQDLINRADHALYKAKGDGRNRVIANF